MYYIHIYICVTFVVLCENLGAKRGTEIEEES